MRQKQSYAKTAQKVLKKASPTILTCIGIVGVAVTAVLAAKATPKALERLEEEKTIKMAENGQNLTRMETIAACWTYYVPTVTAGIATIGCILGVNVLNRRQQASLASAYAFVSHSYADYKRKVKELYGEEAHTNVVQSLAVEKAKDIPIYAQTLVGASNLDFEDANEETRLFYDSFSERYFESTISKVLQAEYHLNRNFMFGGYISLNEFYKFLGLEETELGATVGWNSCSGDIYWIDFNHIKATIDDGLNGEVECYIIDMVFQPDEAYLDDI